MDPQPSPFRKPAPALSSATLPADSERQRTVHPKLTRLESLLQMWEDTYYVANLIDKASAVCRPPIEIVKEKAAVNYRYFRDFMLGKRPDLSIDDFAMPGARHAILEGLVSPVGAIHEPIHQWVTTSRRAYSISHDLQILLQNTSLQGLTWADIKFPFDAFMIQLAEPILFDDKPMDSLLISCSSSSRYDSKLVSFQFLPSTIERYQRITSQQKERLSKALQSASDRTKVVEVVKQGFQLSKNINWPVAGVMFPQGKGVLEELELGDDPKQPSDNREFFRNLQLHGLRIGIGLSLYLRSLPTNSPHVSDWVGVRNAEPDRSSVMLKGEVCTVSSIYRLSTEELAAGNGETRSGNHQLSCHFRVGHWRRPPGQGSNAEAEKTVWVRPTLVRSDRLPPGALPHGTEQQLG